jgi:hypothetical protein
MNREWLSIQVELVHGRGEDFWPRPGRVFAADPDQTFQQLASAIDDAFARWDRAHLHEFTLDDGRRVGLPNEDDDDPGSLLDELRAELVLLGPGTQFAYVFDFGDSWDHLCTIGDQPVDPLNVLGEIPDRPLAFWGWGTMPDQYGRRWEDDDGEGPVPPDPEGSDLPPLQPSWGPD